MNFKLPTLLLASLFLFVLACKKDAATDTADAAATETTTTTESPQSDTLSLEEQAVQTYARARRLSEETQGGFVNNPTNVHEKIASRIIRRVKTVTTISDAQENQVLELVKSYPENTIKGKAGREKRKEIMERAYAEILNAEQRAKVEAALPDEE